MRGSKALLKMMEDRGVENIFGYPGATVIPIYDELLNSPIRHILVRHEQCAAHMADGFARVSGEPGVCLSTSGPGTTNLVTGIATAFADSVPMIALTGQVGTHTLGVGAFQEVDSYSLMMPITKHNFRVLNPERLPHAISEAWQICRTGRPGPVHIDLPVDQINSEIDERLMTREYGIKLPREDVSGIAVAAKWIKDAERPVILAGGGIGRSCACAEVLKFAETVNVPVITTLMGMGAIPSSHPLNMGPVGMHGRMCALDALRNADLVIAIGTKFSDRTYNPNTCPSETCKVVQIDIDATEFGKHGRESVDIECDVKKGITLLTEAIGRYQDNHAAWNTNVLTLKKRCVCDTMMDNNPILPQRVMYEINRIMDDNVIITTDVGQNQMWAMHFLNVERPQQFLSSGSFGTMGFGLPSALGAKTARPESKVISIVGDGGLLMVIQELATSVNENLPVTIVLLDNGWLGMVKQWQKLFWDERYSGTDLGRSTDFVQIAKSFGAEGIHVDRAEDLHDALEQAMACDRTCLLQVKIDPEEDITPMVLANPEVPIVMGRCPYNNGIGDIPSGMSRTETEERI